MKPKQFPELWAELKTGDEFELSQKVDKLLAENSQLECLELYELKGYCAFKLHQIGHAIQAFEMCQIEEFSDDVALALGVCYCFEGNWFQARKIYEQALERDRSTEYGQENLFLSLYFIWVCLEMRDYSTAEKYLDDLWTYYAGEKELDESVLFLKGMPFFEEVLWLSRAVWTRKGEKDFDRAPFVKHAKKFPKKGVAFVERWLEERR